MSNTCTGRGVCAPAGVLAHGVACGIKANGKHDLGLLHFPHGASVAGVFTQNLVKAAPVLLTSEKVKRGHCKAVVVNSGNANACTGQKGMDDAKTMCRIAAHALGCSEEEVLVCSTGVIGEPLPMEAVERGIYEAAKGLSTEGDEAFAQAILTTDTGIKTCTVDCGDFCIGGAAKGAGMIHPNMATMLAFITTDVKASAEELQSLLREAVDLSFNRITVDGDTSTNDTVLLMATGASGAVLEEKRKPFRKGLIDVCQHLAKAIVRDGEGATKLVKVKVEGTDTEEDAKKICSTIATSLLFKTALFGEDPNWGRIAGALGRAGVPIDPNGFSVFIGDVPVVERGVGVEGDWETPAHKVMTQSEFEITVRIGNGPASYWMWTCDLSHGYVSINADYRS